MKKLTILALCLTMLFCFTGCKSDDYEAAIALYDSGDYSAAAAAFAGLEGYRDSAGRAAAAKTAADYETAIALYDSGDYAAAASAFAGLGDYEDSADRAEDAQFINETTQKLAEIEDFVSANELTDYYTMLILNSFPKWDENYALYSELIERDIEDTADIAERFITALGEIEELRFYITIRFVKNLDLGLLEEMVSNIETLGFDDKLEELNEELTRQRYLDFYNTELLSLPLYKAFENITIFPDSEVKTSAEQALSFWQELNSHGGLTRENVERAFSLSDELKTLADSLQDTEQPDYYLKNCLIALAKDFKEGEYDYDYYWQCSGIMGENITPELEAYYAKTSSGKAPIEITGNELYIAPFTDYNFNTRKLTNKLFTSGSPFNLRYASKPEEARYLITFSAATSYYGTYSYPGTTATTKGYSVTVTVCLKDCKTGTVLHTKNISVNPPFQINVSSIPATYYASVSWDDADVDKLISVLKTTLGIE